MILNKKLFFLNKISYKKISYFRSIIKIESFNDSYCDSLGNFIKRNIIITNFCFKISYLKIFNTNSIFKNLKGVKENIEEIIFNLKKIIFKIENNFSAILIIKKKGPCIIKAKDIFSDKKILILNKNEIIATITDSVIFFIIMKCDYSGIEFNNSFFEKKIFFSKIIKIDNKKSPIININYFIKKKIFNKKIKNLFLDIETDGTISCNKSLKNCIFYIKKYFDLFFFYINIKKEKKKEQKIFKLNPIFIRSVDNLELSIRTSNILKKNNIYLIGDLIKKSENDLINFKNMNKNSYLEILESLKNKKFSLNYKMEYEIQF